jgi:NTP pyrophosphatase (non-canonical NTP hydrolase)
MAGENDWTSFEELNVKVLQWANAKGIFKYSNPKSQLLKTVSEVGELADAVNKGNIPEEVDAIGDVLVTLIILAEMHNLDVTVCLKHAYETICNRQGEMVNGVFVKDE